MSDAPGMFDVRLYVFEGQNYVSEKDYRAVLSQRKGFELAALDNETAAKKAKEQLAACRREFFEYRKVAWENEEIGHKALDDLQKAREAGRREGRASGIEDAARVADRWANSSSCDQHDSNPCCHVRTGAGIADAIRRWDDSPKAEVEETK